MKTLFTVLQSLCIAAVTAGIMVEYKFEADIGFLLITIGSFAFALSTKIQKMLLRRELHELLNNKKGQ